MMHKLLQSVFKEMLLQKRDLGGLIILFVMPLVLIITITLIQHSTFQTVSDTPIPILMVNQDDGSVSESVLEQLRKNGAFELVTEIKGKSLTQETAKEQVLKGNYQLAVVIPENISNDLALKIDNNVQEILKEFGALEANDGAKTAKPKEPTPKEIKLYFDPATQVAFRNSVVNGIDNMISKIENESIYQAFQEQIGSKDQSLFDRESFISFREITPSGTAKETLPNAVQHNVPAWTLFAIFFIVVPLSINIVKEKQQGTAVRLLTNPIPYALVLAGKTITYLFICMIQFYLMLAVGIYLFPYFGLPALQLNDSLGWMSVVAFFSGLAAIGFGILLGTIANTTEQSAPFGATSVVVLAAVGGVWVPVFAMPKVMQFIAKASPMNWGLEAFYDVLLRNGSLMEILPEINLLLLFFLITIILAIGYDKKKRAV